MNQVVMILAAEGTSWPEAFVTSVGLVVFGFLCWLMLR